MKTNEQLKLPSVQYESPKMEMINIVPEGVLCESYGEEDGPSWDNY